MAREKERLNLAVVGHVDSGKSTLVGQLRFLCGGVDRRTIEMMEREAFETGRRRIDVKQLVDTLRAEQERGITIDKSMWKIELPNKVITVINTPGHRDFVKNMITGTSMADAVVLVVAATPGEFETGMAKEGQTREHALLAFTLGIKQIIVCVNKIDDAEVKYSQARFDAIRREVSLFLGRVGYKQNKILFIPISALTADNIIERSTNTPWYNGFTLVEALGDLTSPNRQIEKPLRMPLQDVYKIGGIGTIAVGCVQSGILKSRTMVTFVPSLITAEVKSIEMHHEPVTQALPGDYVGFNIKGVSVREIHRGDVVGDISGDPPKICSSFEAHIIILNHPGQIVPGYSPMIDCHTAHVVCQFEKLIVRMDRRTSEILEENPKSLKSGDAGLVRIVPLKPICVEIYSEYPPLGRFVIRDLRQIIGVGVIKSVVKNGASVSSTKSAAKKSEA